jgi:predicted negative regulator of RcsB-dependent stress response
METSHDLDALSMLRSSAEKNEVFGDQNATSSLFSKVIEQAPATWPHRDEVTEQLIRSLLRKGDPRCADEATKAIASPPSNASAARLDLLDAALSCATVKGVSADLRTEIERRVRPEVRALANTPTGLSVEDRDLAYVRLREQAIALGDHDEAAKIARERLSALDEAASAAFERRRGSRFDLLRAMAMVDVGQTELALMMLKNSQEEITDDADTTVRLATFLLKIGRYEAALDEATKGLGHTRGVRVARLHAIRGDALIALNRPHEAREVLEIARARVEALPWAMREDQEIEKLRATIARLSSLP